MRWITLCAGTVMAVAALLPASAPARPVGGDPVALVTAEADNQVLAVSLTDGKILRRVRVAADPTTIAAGVDGPAVVVSPGSGTVTLLAYRTLRTLAVLRGFRSPQVAEITPDGNFAYVTDAATGELDVIQLVKRRVVDRVFVGRGAHHLAVSPDQARTWVAVGERAATIVILDTTTPARPRVLRHFHPTTAAHDLAFAADGRTIWISSSSAPSVSILDAGNEHVVAIVPAGSAPQHIAFGVRNHVYITSGYSSTIETVDARSHKVIRRATIPYGSFNLATAGDLVTTSSLLTGAITELNGANLVRRLTTHIAPKARDLSLSVW